MYRRIIATYLTLMLCALAVTAQGVADVVPTDEVDVALDTAVVRHSRLDSMQYLSGVTVYAMKPYREVIPAQVLSGVVLERLNAHSVADAVRYFSGIQLKDYGGVGGLKTVDVRSMGSNHMGVFYDGVQITNAQNGQVDLGRYSLDGMEEVSLYNGQKSDIFQPASDFGSSGTIYMRTRRPRFDGVRRDNVSVTFRSGSFGLVNPGARWEHKFSESVTMMASGEYTYANGEYHFRYRRRFDDGTLAWDTTAVRHNGDLHALRAEAAVFGNIGAGQWMARAYYYDSRRGIPGAIVNNVWKRAQRQWDRNAFVQGSWRKAFGPRYSLMVNAKLARDWLRYLNPDTTLLLVDNKFTQYEAYVSTAHKLTLTPNWDASLSMDYRMNHLDATLPSFATPTRHTMLASLATARKWRNVKMQASALLTLVDDRSVTRVGEQVIAHNEKWRHRLTPAIFASWQPWLQHDFNLRAFYKRIFTMPSFNDLYYTDVGNASLRPESARQLDAGAVFQHLWDEGVITGVKVQADAYYNVVDDKIVAIPTGSGQYRWTMMNLGKVKIRGIDISARLALQLSSKVALDGQATYTYQRAQDYSNPADCGEGGSYRGQIAYVPWHSGSALLHVAWQRLDVNYSFIYVGERYHNSANIPVNYEQPWYTHDLSASYKFAAHGLTYKIAVEVNNIFDQQYDVILNYPMPGRNFKLTLRVDL